MLRIAVLGADRALCTGLAQELARLRPQASAWAGDHLPQNPAFDLTLLCAQDRPGPAEMRLRAALADAGLAFQVLYGPPAARLRSALNAIDLIAASAYPEGAKATFPLKEPDCAGAQRQRLRALGCEKCSDPVCEHRLFTALRGLGR